MSRNPLLSSPFLLGFDHFERAVERVSKSATDGYPPYNIEKIHDTPSSPSSDDLGTAERLRIVLAVAGFTRDQLEITVEERQLSIRGKQDDGKEHEDRVFLHRGIAARQFHRTFVLADGFEVCSASLENGLLTVDVARPENARCVRRIDITARS